MDDILFREAIPGDAAALGALHAASWRETYAGLLPRAFLDALPDRTAMWRAVLDDPTAFGSTSVFVAERDGRLTGFGACTGQRDPDLQAQGYDGEFAAIYVLRAHQGAGTGRALMRRLARRLLDQGRSAASLWVLRENAGACAFYERLGGGRLHERVEEQAGVTLTEVGYGWADLSSLASGIEVAAPSRRGRREDEGPSAAR